MLIVRMDLEGLKQEMKPMHPCSPDFSAQSPWLSMGAYFYKSYLYRPNIKPDDLEGVEQEVNPEVTHVKTEVKTVMVRPKQESVEPEVKREVKKQGDTNPIPSDFSLPGPRPCEPTRDRDHVMLSGRFNKALAVRR